MDCYDTTSCPNGECEMCDLYIDRVSGWPFVWLRVRRFFVSLWRRDFRTGRF